MSRYVIDSERLIEIANAIRKKSGLTKKMSPSEMAEIIMNITSADDVDALIGRSKTAIESDTATEIGASAFYNYNTLTKAHFPAVTTVGNDAFYGCNALAEVELPSIRTLGARAFYNCSSLTSIDFENSKLSSIPSNSFYGSNLVEIRLPSSVFCSATSNSFAGCPIGAGGSGGTVYLPSRYRTAYEANSGWSNVIRNSANRIISY